MLAAYFLRRLIMAAVVVLLVMTFLALLVHFIPGNPVTTIMGQRASPQLADQVRHEMELDRPISVQVIDFIKHAFEGNLGADFLNHVPVATLIKDALPHTVALAAAALLLAIMAGVPLGVIAATQPSGLVDRVTGVFSMSMITVPSYVAGLLLVLLFSVHFHFLPAIGTGSFSHPIDYLRHLLLPATALAISWVGYLARLVRASMLEVMGANYIRTARAFGLRERLIFYKYALKNALVPTIAVLGVAFGHLMGGAIFAEVIFARSGIGLLIFNAISERDYPIVRGGVLVISVLFVFSNLVADLCYRLLDPRLRMEARA